MHLMHRSRIVLYASLPFCESSRRTFMPCIFPLKQPESKGMLQTGLPAIAGTLLHFTLRCRNTLCALPVKADDMLHMLDANGEIKKRYVNIDADSFA